MPHPGSLVPPFARRPSLATQVRDWCRVACVALALFTLGTLPSAVDAQSNLQPPDVLGDFQPTGGRPILDVRVVGNRRVSRNQVLARLKTRPDRPFDPDLVQADVQELMLTKEFRNVRPYVAEQAEGVVVTFEVTEKPRIEKINYYGNRAVMDRILAKETGLKVGDPLDLYSLRLAKERIEEYYRRKGFPRTEVSLINGDKPNDTEVTFLVAEDFVQKIVDVEFIGNQFVSGARLESFVKSKPGIFAPAYRNRFVREVLEADKARLTTYYREFGFFRAVVDSEVQYNDDHSSVSVRFVINEGPRYKVRNVSLAGNAIYTTEDLDSLLELRADQHYDGGQMQRDLNTLKDLYGSNGYIQALVEPDLLFLEEPGYVDLVYKIEEGEQYRVGRINVHIGGEYGVTRQSVVLARLDLRPGDIVDIRKIRDSERRLGASGLFMADPAAGQVPRIEVSPSEDGFERHARAAFRSPEGEVSRFQSPDVPAGRTLDIDVLLPESSAAMPEDR